MGGGGALLHFFKPIQCLTSKIAFFVLNTEYYYRMTLHQLCQPSKYKLNIGNVKFTFTRLTHLRLKSAQIITLDEQS